MSLISPWIICLCVFETSLRLFTCFLLSRPLFTKCSVSNLGMCSGLGGRTLTAINMACEDSTNDQKHPSTELSLDILDLRM